MTFVNIRITQDLSAQERRALVHEFSISLQKIAGQGGGICVEINDSAENRKQEFWKESFYYFARD